MFTKIINSWVTKPTALLLALSIFLMSFTPYVPPTNGNGDDIEGGIVLRAGTTIPLQCTSTLNSATLQTGQNVTFTVANDIKVNGKTVIERGAIANGVVTEAHDHGVFGIPGKFSITIKSVTAVDGTQVFLANSDIFAQGKAKYGVSISLSAIICILFMFIKGDEATNSGSITVAVASDTEVQVD